MKIEHVAYQVADPAAFARWYQDHLGLTVKRIQKDPPYAYFLADDGDAVMIEAYNNPAAAVPDYTQLDPVVQHIAFSVPDATTARDQLLAAGATAVGEIVTKPSGDRLAMLRDPWGLPVQLVERATPLL